MFELSIDVLIAFKNSEPERLRNLIFIIDYYHQYLPDAKIILVEDGNLTKLPNDVDIHIKVNGADPDLFNRSLMLNIASKHSTAAFYLLADTDCVPEIKVLNDIYNIAELNHDKYTVVHSKVYYLNPDISERFVSEQSSNIGQELSTGEYHTTATTAGGVTLCGADLFYALNGFRQQKYIGWGGEDDDLYNRCAVNGAIERIDAKLFHLHHPPVDGGAFSKNPVGFTPQHVDYKRSKVPPADLISPDYRISEIKKFMADHKIGLATCSANNALFKKSRQFTQRIFEDIYVINGSGGLYGYDSFIKMFEDPELTKFDYLIYTDEDNFIVGWSSLVEMIKTFIDGGYGFAGMPDGGVISHRFHNPIAINPFLAIFDLKQIRKLDLSNINGVYKKDLNVFIPNDLIKTWDQDSYPRIDVVLEEGYKPFDVSYDNFEPYYKLWFYFLRNGLKPLYLDAYDAPYMDDDGCCTELVGTDNDVISYHAWFARSYGKDSSRIDKIHNRARAHLRW